MKTTGITLAILIAIYLLLFFEFKLEITGSTKKVTIEYQGAFWAFMY